VKVTSINVLEEVNLVTDNREVTAEF